MSETPTLLEGFIKSVVSIPEYSTESPVILQLLSLKPVNSDKGLRYRVVISDGKNFCQGILSSQLNGLVESDDLKKNSVFHARKYIVNDVSGSKLLFILDLDIVNNDLSKIGEPEELNNDENGPTPPTSPVPSPLSSPQKSPYKVLSRPANFAPPSPEKSHLEVFPISSLNPYQAKWAIKARVSNKSEVKSWSNAKGNGKFFSVVLVDESGEIKATGFTDIVEKYYDQLEVGKIYIISRGSVKPAKKQFSSLKNDYEITFDSFTSIKKSEDQEAKMPEIFFRFIPLEKLTSLIKDSVVDVIGILKESTDVIQINTKYQKEMSKRDIIIFDSSQKSVKITLWGNIASGFEETEHVVVAIKGARVSDYGGISLSTISSSIIQINPEIEEMRTLKKWYEDNSSNVSITSMTVQSNSMTDAPNQRKYIKEVETEKLGSKSNQVDLFNLKATITNIPHDKNFYYTACPTTGAKVVQNSQGWYCEKTKEILPTCDYRYILKIQCMDFSGGIWLSLFNDTAHAILQKPALDLFMMKEESHLDQFEEVFKNAIFKSYVFRVRAKSEMYNGDSFARYQVMSCKPLDYVSESKMLVSSIQTLMKK